MSVIAWIAVVTGVILCGVVLIPLSQKIRVPRDGLLLLLGFVASEIVTSQGYDTGLRWYYFKDIVFFGVLPLLVFNTALHIDSTVAKREISSMLVLALPIRLVTVSLIGLAMFYGIGHQTGFPLVAALLLAVILTAPDPDSMIEHANLSHAYPRVCLMLRGESLLDDVLAVVLFSLLLSMVAMSATPPSVTDLASRFVWVLVGGVMLGIAIGKISSWLLTKMPTDSTKVMFLISIVYLGFILAEKFFTISGVVMMLVFGLTVSRSCAQSMKTMFGVFAEILSIGLFFVTGMTLTVSMFTDRWLAIVLAGTALIFARAIGIYFFALWRRFSSADRKLTREENCLMMVAGVPGAVALALALSLPLDVPGWYTIQAAVYGVVILGIISQTPLITAVFNRLKTR